MARHLGLGYPGGPVIDRLARDGDPAAIRFPRAMPGEADFSFAGLKTAVVNHHAQQPDVAGRRRRRVVPGGGRRPAGRPSCWPRPTAPACPTLAIGGGVAANSRLRAKVAAAAAEATGRRAFLPRPALCTDNGAMIAATAWWRLRADGPTPLDAGADPNLRLG